MKSPILILALLVSMCPLAGRSEPLGEAWEQAKTMAQESRKNTPVDSKTAPQGTSAVAEGPRAALEFERKYRGEKIAGKPLLDESDPNACTEKCYDGKPIPWTDLKTIKPLDESFWRKEQLIADFNEKKPVGKDAILVLIKTEACCCNKMRLCAVATAAIEKLSTPLLKRFVIYGAWIYPDDAREASEKTDTPERKKWYGEVDKHYDFDLGPGANLIFINPKDGSISRSNASELSLIVEEFEKDGGYTPKLEKKLDEVLNQFAKDAASVKQQK